MLSEFCERDVVPYKIYTRGENESGQTGNGEQGNVKEWFRVSLPHNSVIKHISSGYYFYDNELYGFGQNAYAQLAPKTEVSFQTPRILSRGDAESCTLKMVACGSYFAVVLSESGEIFGRGHGQFLGLGPSDVEVQNLTKLGHAVLDGPIDYIDCGAATIGCITKSGTLFVHGITLGKFVKIKIPNEQRIHKISMGYSSIAIITDTGKLYTHGFSGNQSKCTEYLSEVTAFSVGRVINASCGYDISAFIAGNQFYAVKNNFTARQRSLDASSVKQIMCRFTTNRVFAVTNDDKILLCTAKGEFKVQKSPVEHNERIVGLLTGYNFEILIVGKKRHFKLHAGYKFDDIDVITVSQ